MIRIYLANLGKYNESCLVGDWIELPFDEEQLEDLFCRIKLGYRDSEGEYHHGYAEGDSYYEEWAIHDYETDIEMRIGEYEDIHELNDLAEELDELCKEEINDLNLIIKSTGYDIRYCLQKLQSKDYYIINNIEDEEDLGAALVREEYFGIDIPEELENYIDYEAIGREYSMTGWNILDGYAICVN